MTGTRFVLLFRQKQVLKAVASCRESIMNITVLPSIFCWSNFMIEGLQILSLLDNWLADGSQRRETR